MFTRKFILAAFLVLLGGCDKQSDFYYKKQKIDTDWSRPDVSRLVMRMRECNKWTPDKIEAEMQVMHEQLCEEAQADLIEIATAARICDGNETSPCREVESQLTQFRGDSLQKFENNGVGLSQRFEVFDIYRNRHWLLSSLFVASVGALLAAGLAIACNSLASIGAVLSVVVVASACLLIIRILPVTSGSLFLDTVATRSVYMALLEGVILYFVGAVVGFSTGSLWKNKKQELQVINMQYIAMIPGFAQVASILDRFPIEEFEQYVKERYFKAPEIPSLPEYNNVAEATEISEGDRSLDVDADTENTVPEKTNKVTLPDTNIMSGDSNVDAVIEKISQRFKQ
ncbi:hypothetical protein SCD_n03042 (plasmid) [Sulfuricella denitrificans skB26]|uniref:Lipoprotein n=1 Tax=Sulfuricella denitrificans (strain DSM 22764 / NBRC 105220 / skB26) TaxID=1163617 RepID=S6AKC0_SULDS|nr:hypothetical protein [Sulfuricella denitrificans]BAN36841.1 hypothetical protein SCD_n03042 [Sulfuricella denitrificans skB26]